ncbi:hypothetical protein Vretimale_2567 [Volvox reticuliferus]|uniref:tRNA-splicing endonuclease subunit Sen54 N-terminal domain-containing protein n=1 Tax=Volvox reticuliferus TaxID=1737510 RepID=A0A8J4DBJ3_9CHLO|nr:hypothetical protein Vretifemale_4801 [Volvox reticuliferus]GIL96764.1 hypothetical protein Vretimale_2567 [Volvox reticuliferus]
MPLSASIFRRGGPKKELFDVINEDVDDEKELDGKLAELEELLHSDKTGRELSAAIWRPSLCAAELVKQRKQCARDMGFIRGHRIYLHVEEAVYSLDRGDLLLFVEEPLPQQQQDLGVTAAGAAGAGEEGRAPEWMTGDNDAAFGSSGDGRRRQTLRQRLLSVQEAFDLMISMGVSMERYMLYSSLSRSGYLVMRHPSRWLLGREEQPEQVWGSGAWSACYGLVPTVPGTAPHQPMQQQLAVPRAAAPAVAAGDAASAMEVESRSGAPGVGAVAASTSRQHNVWAGKQQKSLLLQRRGAAVGADHAAPAAAAAGAAECRGWWLVAGPDHPLLHGVPAEYFRTLPPAVVVDRLATSLRSSFPNLQPLPTIRSVLEVQAPVPGAPLSARAPAHGGDASAVTITAGTAGSEDLGAAAAIAGGISLGTPSENAHLVFDVYKPGSFISRYKGQFPVVQTHVAMCSAAPPTLVEMRAADAMAAAAVPPGESAGPARVTWATVLNGDIALFSIGEADLIGLV